MAKIYLEKLTALVSATTFPNEVASTLVTKHFFSGAALYADGNICASWSPVGLAFKLPDEKLKPLIDSGVATGLRYFPEGHVKKGYALFKDPDQENVKYWRDYLISAIAHC